LEDEEEEIIKAVLEASLKISNQTNPEPI